MIVEFGKDGYEFVYRLKSRNGQVMLTSRRYQSYLSCVLGWRTVQRKLFISDTRIKYNWSKEFNYETKRSYFES